MCRPLFFPLIGLFLSSCTGNTLYHHYLSLPAEGWERRDTVCFEVPKTEEGTGGILFVGLRTAAHIGMQDIVIAVEQTSEAGEILRCDTIRYALTDADGKALTGGVNKLQYETECVPFLRRKGKSHSVRIHHLMRHEVISGITEVGRRVERTP